LTLNKNALSGLVFPELEKAPGFYIGMVSITNDF